VYKMAGLPHDAMSEKEVAVRGRSIPIVVRIVAVAERLDALFS
jgi:hypothetical protein